MHPLPHGCWIWISVSWVPAWILSGASLWPSLCPSWPSTSKVHQLTNLRELLTDGMNLQKYLRLSNKSHLLGMGLLKHGGHMRSWSVLVSTPLWLFDSFSTQGNEFNFTQGLKCSEDTRTSFSVMRPVPAKSMHSTHAQVAYKSASKLTWHINHGWFQYYQSLEPFATSWNCSAEEFFLEFEKIDKGHVRVRLRLNCFLSEFPLLEQNEILTAP